MMTNTSNTSNTITASEREALIAAMQAVIEESARVLAKTAA